MLGWSAAGCICACRVWRRKIAVIFEIRAAVHDEQVQERNCLLDAGLDGYTEDEIRTYETLISSWEKQKQKTALLLMPRFVQVRQLALGKSAVLRNPPRNKSLANIHHRVSLSHFALHQVHHPCNQPNEA